MNSVPSGESSEPHVCSGMRGGALWQMRGSSSVFVGLGLALGKALPLVQSSILSGAALCLRSRTAGVAYPEF